MNKKFMVEFIFKNQRLVNQKQAQVSIDERGFLFGDGLFETLHVSDGQILDFSLHLKRIRLGLKALKFKVEVNKQINNLEKKSYQLIKKNKLKNGLLKISISRGVGSVGYLPTYKSQPLIIIQTSSLRKLPKKITLGISSISAPKTEFQNAFKSMNALPYILAKIEAQEKGFFDCVMLSEKKLVSEVSASNIFWVKNKKIYTPHLDCGSLAGCIRERLLKIKSLKIKEVKAKISELKNADEIFLTNSAFLLLGVDEIDLGEGIKTLQKEVSQKIKKVLNGALIQNS